MEKKEEERERERERETPRNAPRERLREREQARAPLRSKYALFWSHSQISLAAVSRNSHETDVRATRSCSGDANGLREILVLENNAKVPPIRERRGRHLKICSHNRRSDDSVSPQFRGST